MLGATVRKNNLSEALSDMLTTLAVLWSLSLARIATSCGARRPFSSAAAPARCCCAMLKTHASTCELLCAQRPATRRCQSARALINPEHEHPSWLFNTPMQTSPPACLGRVWVARTGAHLRILAGHKGGAAGAALHLAAGGLADGACFGNHYRVTIHAVVRHHLRSRATASHQVPFPRSICLPGFQSLLRKPC
jgi:hypothetical protein